MSSVTKTAMKAIKFYKHVVQNVEKFILKCKPEYKIPGLYVIDSIVRQSRHQFGPEKDVFAPRFARNMEETFAHLFRCSQEDKVSLRPCPLTSYHLMTHSILEQNHPRPQFVAEEQRLCAGSHPAAIRFSQPRPSGASGVYAATTEPARRADERHERRQRVATERRRTGERRNGNLCNFVAEPVDL